MTVTEIGRHAIEDARQPLWLGQTPAAWGDVVRGVSPQEAHDAASMIAAAGLGWTVEQHPLEAVVEREYQLARLPGRVARTRRPARVDDYSEVPGEIAATLAREAGIHTAVGVPILVDGSPWGVMMALSTARKPLRDGVETRLAAFTELVATAIANTQARDDLRRLAEEQAALRRIALLVATEADQPEVFAAVAREVSRVLDDAMIEIVRCEPNRRATGVGAWGAHPFVVGSQWTLDGPSVIASVLDTGRPARIDDYADLSGSVAAFARDAGFRCAVGAPIVVDGKTWGVINVISQEPTPLPPDTEARLAAFSELVATAISRTEAREALRKSEELYRRAIAEAGAVPYVLDYETGAYSFIGDGIEELTGYRPAELTWEAFGGLVLETYLHGDQARLDATDAAYRTRAGEFERWRTDLRIRRRDGEVRWLADASVEILPEDGPSLGSIGMLQDITERMRTEEERLRLAAIIETTTDVVTLTDVDGHMLYMNRAGRRLLGLSANEDLSGLTVSDLQPQSAAARVVEEGIPLAVRDGVWSGESALLARDGIEIPVSQVILAHKDAHGTVTFLSGIARDLTERLEFEDRLRRTQSEQAALRQVATLVAQEAEPSAVFDAVAAEVARLFDIEMTSILSYEPDGTAIKVGGYGVQNPYAVGAHLPPNVGVIPDVWRSGRNARVDDYRAIPDSVAERLAEAGIRSSVGVPIVVNGTTWGVMVALSTAVEPLPSGTEERLARFTTLVATALANSQARAELRQLIDEQTALRRVATLVAEGAGSRGVLDAVSEETGRLLGASSVNLCRFTSDGFNLTMAGWSQRDTHVQTGTRLPLEGEPVNVLVRRTGAPARVDSYAGVSGELAELVRARGIKSEVAAPVIVEGEVWGALIAGWDDAQLPPEGTEFRLGSFAELIATAVSNASNRSELVASRARIVAASDETRRRIERNLHDGVQQQLVALELELKAIETRIPSELQEPHEDLDRVQGALEAVLNDVREISQGVHPATLSQWGLGPALRTLTRRSPIPVELEIDVPDRLAQSIEIAVYYVVSEALANVVKHAGATHASVDVAVVDGWLRARIRDDGSGGADAERGSGLTGLVDRVEALGGRLTLVSPRGEGTALSVGLPLATDQS
jgi:PAS domain S-box-containing protein